MKNLRYLDAHRIPFEGMMGDETCGMFELKLEGSNLTFRVVASGEGGWEHVSVSTQNRCPRWNEMCQIKNMFWEKSDVVVQYHPAEEDYVNMHEYCLHLWKPTAEQMPKPPKIMVGY